MQQEAELIGPETMAAEAIGEAGVLAILDPEFRLTTPHIAMVERKRRQVGPAGDDEAQIAAFGEFLGFVHHPPLVRPRLGRLLAFAGQAHFRAAELALALGRRDKGSSQRLQPRVGGKADRVGELFTLAVAIEGRDRETAVSAPFELHVWPMRTQGGDESLEDG